MFHLCTDMRMESMKATGMKEVFVEYVFCSRIAQNVLFHFGSLSDKVMRRHVWMEVETSCDSWEVVKSFLIFIYTPVISISLASKPSMQRIELSCSLSLSSLLLLPSWCRI